MKEWIEHAQTENELYSQLQSQEKKSDKEVKK
jgi:hypothetical protein